MEMVTLQVVLKSNYIEQFFENSLLEEEYCDNSSSFLEISQILCLDQIFLAQLTQYFIESDIEYNLIVSDKNIFIDVPEECVSYLLDRFEDYIFETILDSEEDESYECDDEESEIYDILNYDV